MGGTATPTIIPDLATSWKASKNNTVFTLTLRQGVLFHDGTPFTSAAVEPSFARDLAVGQGPSYMPGEVASVTTQGKYGVTITLKSPNPNFPAYLASAYGPRMMSPPGLAAHAGSDHDETYLRTHDLGTGPYELTEARVGSMYQLKAFSGYWGPKPYFTTVNLPVITDSATQQLEFDKGSLAAIMHDLPESAVRAYLKQSSVRSYSLPTLNSDFLYVNPAVGFLTTAAHRMALLEAVNVKSIYTGGLHRPGDDRQPGLPGAHDERRFRHPEHPVPAVRPDRPGEDPAVKPADVHHRLRLVVTGQPARGQPAVGRAHRAGAQRHGPVLPDRADLRLGAARQDRQGRTRRAARRRLAGRRAALHVGPHQLRPERRPELPALLDPADHQACSPRAWPPGARRPSRRSACCRWPTGCWDNLVNQDDFMVAQPWLKGVAAAHVVTYPNSLNLFALSVG